MSGERLPRSRTTLDPEPSPPSPRCTEPKPKPTADGEPRPATINEPSPMRVTELEIVLDLELLRASDQVFVPPTVIAMDSKSVEGSSAHCTMAEGEPSSVDSNLDLYADMPCILPPSSSVCPVMITEVVFELSACPELSVCPELSACVTMTIEVVPLSLVLPVLGVALWCVWAAHTIPKCPDHPEIPPASLPHHLCTSPHHHHRCLLAAPLLTLSPPSASWLQDPLSPPPASES